MEVLAIDQAPRMRPDRLILLITVLCLIVAPAVVLMLGVALPMRWWH